jgi:hypothetical protein
MNPPKEAGHLQVAIAISTIKVELSFDVDRHLHY